MANYKPDLSCQNKFIPINFAEQILPGTFEYALCYIVEKENQRGKILTSYIKRASCLSIG